MSNNADASLFRTVRRAVPSLSWPAIKRATGEVFEEFDQIGDRQDDSFRVSLRNLVGDCAVKSRAAWEGADGDHGAFENSIIESHQENWTWAS
jgi:hypothetical protein